MITIFIEAKKNEIINKELREYYKDGKLLVLIIQEKKLSKKYMKIDQPLIMNLIKMIKMKYYKV